MRNVTKSSGNVFRDLGLPDADVLQAKADLVFQISRLIEKRGLTRRRAAAILEITQPKLSALLSGQIDRFSVETITNFFNALNQEIQITKRPKRTSVRRRLAVG